MYSLVCMSAVEGDMLSPNSDLKRILMSVVRVLSVVRVSSVVRVMSVVRVRFVGLVRINANTKSKKKCQ